MRSSSGPQPSKSPIFILTSARSGSTLLRVLLDSHPAVSCPAELNLTVWIGALLNSWQYLELESMSLEDRLRVATIQARRVATQLMQRRLEDTGKRRWCDKSLPNALQVDLIKKVFPKAKLLCLYRHPLDVVMSGIEASTWGYNGFGFFPHVQKTPGNVVQALTEYWLETSEAILHAEREWPKDTLRIHYEALVLKPNDVLEIICEFIGEDYPDDLIDLAFTNMRPENGPGDRKFWTSSGISTDSIGNGKKVPIQLLPAPLLARVNALLNDIDYPLVSTDWNTEPTPFHIDDSPHCEPDSCSFRSSLFSEVLGPFRHRITNCSAILQSGIPESLSLFIDDAPHACCRGWRLNFKALEFTPTEDAGEFAIYCSIETAVALLTKTLNPAIALSSGALRIKFADGMHPAAEISGRWLLFRMFGAQIDPVNQTSLQAAL